jgi:hypothetical protein
VLAAGTFSNRYCRPPGRRDPLAGVERPVVVRVEVDLPPGQPGVVPVADAVPVQVDVHLAVHRGEYVGEYHPPLKRLHHGRPAGSSPADTCHSLGHVSSPVLSVDEKE